MNVILVILVLLILISIGVTLSPVARWNVTIVLGSAAVLYALSGQLIR